MIFNQRKRRARVIAALVSITNNMRVAPFADAKRIKLAKLRSTKAFVLKAAHSSPPARRRYYIDSAELWQRVIDDITPVTEQSMYSLLSTGANDVFAPPAPATSRS